MRRRAFLSSSAAVLAVPAFAQAPSTARIGWLSAQRPPSLAPYVVAYREALAELGWVERRNLVIEFRFGDDDLGRVPALAEELVALRVDVIVAQGAAVYEISRLGLKLPVVYVYSGDPVVAGLAQSLAKPLYNMTGLTFMAAELNAKRLEMLREMVPRLQRVTLLANPEHPGEVKERRISQDAARDLGLQVRYEPVRTPEELEAALQRMSGEPPQAISLFADGFAVQNRDRIIGFGMRHRAPVISGWPVFADSGALASFGPRLVDSYRRLAAYTDRVLKGARPADLPIEQPTTFETVLNLKTADALGLRIPEALLVRADRLIR